MAHKAGGGCLKELAITALIFFLCSATYVVWTLVGGA